MLFELGVAAVGALVGVGATIAYHDLRDARQLRERLRDGPIKNLVGLAKRYDRFEPEWIDESAADTEDLRRWYLSLSNSERNKFTATSVADYRLRSIWGWLAATSEEERIREMDAGWREYCQALWALDEYIQTRTRRD